MKPRKRVLPAAKSSCVRANVTHESTSETRCSSGSSGSVQFCSVQFSAVQFGLRILAPNFVQVPVADEIDDTLAVAVKAFQAQLEVFSKQSPRHTHVGFKQLARKRRLEFRVGDEALGQLGLLQGVATTVRDCNATLQPAKLSP